MSSPQGTRDDAINRRRRASAKDARKQYVADLQWLMTQTPGRRIVWQWIEKAGIYNTVFSTHAGEMNFREGRRNFGLELIKDLVELTPHEFDVMQQENRPARAPTQTERNDDTEPESAGN